MSLQPELEELRKIALGDLYVFAKGILGFDLLQPHIHLDVCRLLELYDGWNESLGHPREVYEKVLRDKHIRPHLTDAQIESFLSKGLKRLGFILPRSWLKTTICSIAYPMWRAARNPEMRCLLAQNTFKNACSKNKVIKGSFEKSVLLQALFPHLMPTSDCTWSAESLCLNRKSSWPEGTFEAAGTKTQVVSRHYDVIGEDDTVAPNKEDLGEDALLPSKEDIAQAVGWHRLVPPLLQDAMQSQNLVVATRWYVDDLISWILSKEPEFIFFMRACKENEKGEPDEDGVVQYPERFNEEVLTNLRNRMGPYLYSCLYLNMPLSTANMNFRPEWITYYDTEPRSLMCYTTVDPAGDPELSAQSTDTDYNVVLTCGKDLITGRIYVLEYFREKCSPGELLNALFAQVRRWGPVKVKVETTAYQQSLQYWIKERQQKEQCWFLVEGCPHPKGAKEFRILGLQPLLANGMIMLRPHMQALVTELLAHPLGKHDDLIDALAAQLDMWCVTPLADTKEELTLDDELLSMGGVINELRGRRRTGKRELEMALEHQRVLAGLN